MRIRARHYATRQACGHPLRRKEALPPSRDVRSLTQPGGGLVAPAFFDLQINGCDGHSFNTERLTVDTVRHVVRVCPATRHSAACAQRW